jgi:hypothetical protein
MEFENVSDDEQVWAGAGDMEVGRTQEWTSLSEGEKRKKLDAFFGPYPNVRLGRVEGSYCEWDYWYCLPEASLEEREAFLVEHEDSMWDWDEKAGVWFLGPTDAESDSSS